MLKLHLQVGIKSFGDAIQIYIFYLFKSPLLAMVAVSTVFQLCDNSFERGRK
jgi:hypothetical protein